MPQNNKTKKDTKRNETDEFQEVLVAEPSGEYEKKGYLYDDFRMFHLCDDEERQYEYHYHDFYKILICISGAVTYNIEGRSYRLKPYDVVLVNRFDIHKPQVVAGEAYERVIFYISKEYLNKHIGIDYDLAYPFQLAEKEQSEVLRFPAITNARLMETVRAIEENADGNNYAGKLYANVLFMEFMILLCRACAEHKDCFSHNVIYNQKMIDILQYINEHLEEDLSVESIAENFFISRYHMMRQFKEETGYTLHRYIVEKRIVKARNMILAGMPATKACYACGFQDYSTFLRAYKSRMGKNPSEMQGVKKKYLTPY